jgi:hypothetical protein
VVFNGARSEAQAIRNRIKDEFQSWRLARLFRSDTFGFPEPFPFRGGMEIRLSHRELSPLVDSMNSVVWAFCPLSSM